MFFFLTWYVKRTPYVVLILMYSRSSGFSPSVSRPVRLRQHSRHAFSLLPTFSFSHPPHLLILPPPHLLILSPSHPQILSLSPQSYIIIIFISF